MRYRTLFALAAVLAAAFPATAEAHPGREAGRHTFELGEALVLKGHGRLYGHVEAPGLDVLFRGRVGILRVLDVAGDAVVTCGAEVKEPVRTNDEGHKLYVCGGRGGRASVTGSSFRFGAFALRLQAAFPQGAAGKVMAIGLWVTGSDADDEPGLRDRLEDLRDRFEDGRDQLEDRRDRFEDRRDRLEDRRDRWENRRDRHEDRHDRAEDEIDSDS